jgi:hypothetical protein
MNTDRTRIKTKNNPCFIRVNPWLTKRSATMANSHVARRTFLKGLGTAVALPLLDAMLPARAVAAPAAKSLRRMAFLSVPNGAHMQDWTPATEGIDFKFPATLECLTPYREYVSVMSGLTHDKARPNGDGPGDHARSAAALLTGSQPRKTAGADIKVGISVDQLAAQKVGGQTRFPSLELGCEPGQQSGNCDSGYSCAYSNNISWRTENTPVPKEIDPRLVFERLFGNGKVNEEAASKAKRAGTRKSVLDFALEDARNLRDKLGVRDQQKLDEYLYSIREVEHRITRVELVDKDGEPNITPPGGVPRDYGEHLGLMFDLLALAYRGDQTRIATFMLANEGSNRGYAGIGVREGHHDLSHHGGNKEKQAKIAKINRFHMEAFAHFLGRLQSIREGEGTILDSAMIFYGSGIGDGNRHNHDDLPVLLVGKGGGTIESGRHVKFKRNTPAANLFLSMLDRVGVSIDEFGDSTGHLFPRIG